MARRTPGSDRLPVVVEVGTRRTFASVLDWPGWCRSAKDEAQALEALAAYRPRYEPVASGAGLVLPAAGGPGAFEVVEHLPGRAGTDFGVPEVAAASELVVPGPAQGERLASIMTSAWEVFARVAADAPAELRKGPRGGGRDRDAMVDHVEQSENGYARKLGVRHPPPTPGDTSAVAAVRADLLVVVRTGRTPELPRGTPWPLRYAVRRIVWHVLDHAWEMEDRSVP